MVQITPFKGLLYNRDKTGPLSKVVAPPYDVIKPDLQEELYRRSPYNIVRLILGMEFDDDSKNENRYTRSAKALEQWTGEEGALVQDNQPCYYAYSQEYQADGRRLRRMGFFTRVKLEDFSAGNICPHEHTLAKAKKDRLSLLQACRANLSPIFGLFSDPDRKVDEKLQQASGNAPLDIIEEDGVTHKLWRIEDPEIISFLSSAFEDKKVYIADGHHRYETALTYHKTHGNPESDSAHVMMFLANLDSGSLSVFPIHRLVQSPRPFDTGKFLSQAENHFTLEPLADGTSAHDIKSILADAGKNRGVLAVYLGRGKSLLLRLKDPRSVIPYLNQDEPEELQVLDVVQLHAMIIKPLLGVDTRNPENQRYVSYTTSIESAMNDVDSGKSHLAFFMNPTPVTQVRNLAEKGIRLPQKATYFYPKLLSGLVINRFNSKAAPPAR